MSKRIKDSPLEALKFFTRSKMLTVDGKKVKFERIGMFSDKKKDPESFRENIKNDKRYKTYTRLLKYDKFYCLYARQVSKNPSKTKKKTKQTYSRKGIPI